MLCAIIRAQRKKERGEKTMTAKELVHIAKSIGATEITKENINSSITKDVTICSTQGKYGVKAVLFRAADGKYYYICKPYGFIYKFI